HRAVHHLAAAGAADELAVGPLVPVGPPAAPRTADLPRRRPPRRGDDLAGLVAPFGLGADADTGRLPLPAVPGIGAQGMGDFVQNRVSDLLYSVEEREVPAEGDGLLAEPARPEPPPRVIKGKGPAGQAVLGHQGDRKMSRSEQIHDTAIMRWS